MADASAYTVGSQDGGDNIGVGVSVGVDAGAATLDPHKVLGRCPGRCLGVVGVRRIGGGKQAGNSGARFLLLLFVTSLAWSLQWFTFYYAVGLPVVPSALVVLLTLVPMMCWSAHHEVEIFGSVYLARELARSERMRRKLKDFWFRRGMQSVVGQALTWGVPFALAVWPMFRTEGGPQPALLVLVWSTLIVVLAHYLSWIPLQQWEILTEEQQRLTMDAVRACCQEMLTILADDTLSVGEAADRLGDMHHGVLRELHDELRIWGNQAGGLGFMAPAAIVHAIFLLLSSVDASQIQCDASLAAALRIAVAIMWLVTLLPWAFGFLYSAAGPNKVWRGFVRDVTMDAKVMRRALEKFQGSGRALADWLDQNKICLRLAGLPIDDSLIGKLAAMLGSATSVGVLILARMGGYY